jgi:hypothetical protein
MRLSSKLAVVFVIAYGGSLNVSCVRAQSHPSPSELVQKLQSEKTTDQARRQLLQLGKSDPDLRQYLAVHLPTMIQAGPNSCPPSNISDIDAKWHSCPWYNAVELAGKLRIGEAAPALGQWIAVRTYGGIIIGISSEFRLDAYPGATALWQIGNPAVPVVQHILESDQGPRSRFIDERVLCIINTPESKAALRDFLPRESDPELQARIKSCLGE